MNIFCSVRTGPARWLLGWCVTVLLGVAAANAQPYRVAVFEHPQWGPEASLVEAYTRSLEARGLAAERIDLETLTNPEALRSDRYEALMLLDSPRTPARALSNVHQFMRDGGDVVLLGGEAFASPVSDAQLSGRDQQSLTQQFLAAPAVAQVDWLGRIKADALEHGANDPARPFSATPMRGPKGKPSVEFAVKGFDAGWASWRAFIDPAPANANVLRLWVRGSERTTQLAVELAEARGVRWAITIEPTNQWQHLAIPLSDFTMFRSGETPQRGGEGDTPRPEALVAVSIGLADEFFSSTPGDHAFAVSQMDFASVDYQAEKTYDNPFQHPGFVLYPFDYLEEYELPEQSRLTPREGVLQDEAWRGEPLAFAGGVSAMGVGLPDRSRMMPLLQVEDPHGRVRGWGLSLLHHDGGPYEGGRWIFSGVHEGAVTRDPRFVERVTATLGRLASGDTSWLVETTAYSEPASAKSPDAAASKPSPLVGRLIVSEDGSSFVDQEGRPAFLIGFNYAGPFGRSHIYAGERWWNGPQLVADFRAAAAMGINSMRIWVSPELGHDPAKVQTILDAAEAHGIYLLVHFRGDGLVELNPTDLRKVVSDHRQLVEAFAGHPMVLGFDIQNEPYITTIGSMTTDGQISAIVKLRPAEKFAEHLDQAELEEKVRQRPPWPSMGKWMDDDMARQLYAAEMLWNRIGNPIDPSEGFEPLPEAVAAELTAAIDATFAKWIEPLREMILEADPQALVTVGYNSDLAVLPCNGKLDFMSYHTYERPKQVADTRKNVEVMDTLAEIWPSMPVSLGEFGYSAAFAVGNEHLGQDSIAVGEMIFYLSAYANGHFGVYKWQLHDEPIPYLFDQITWAQGALEHMRYESAMGLFRYDGSPTGSPRPLAWGLRHFSQYLYDQPEAGQLELHATDYPGGAGYTYRAEHAFFVGDTSYEDDRVRFTSESPANVMIDWSENELRLMSTADAEIWVDISALTGRAAGDGQSTTRSLELLAGQEVVISLQTP